jgi:hypothetical protein
MSKILKYTGKEQREFTIKHELSTSPKRKFGCKLDDEWVINESINEKTAMFLAKMYQSFFRVVERIVTDEEICRFRINDLIDKFGYDTVYKSFQSERDEISSLDSIEEKKKGRPKKNKKDV